MACCCTNILELCRVSVCGTTTIQPGVNAPVTGIYTLVLEYLGVEVMLQQEIQIGQPIEFPAADLNENYKYTGKIIGPDNEPLTITVDEIEYDCISFQTQLSFDLTQTPE